MEETIENNENRHRTAKERILRFNLTALAVLSSFFVMNYDDDVPTNNKVSAENIMAEPITSDGADASVSPARIPIDIVAPSTVTLPASELDKIRNLTVSFNGCSASIILDNQAQPLGIIGAKHCIIQKDYSNFLWFGHNFVHSGTMRHIGLLSNILQDPKNDIFYLGDFGHTNEEVRQQLIINNQLIKQSSIPLNNLMYVAGFPSYNNPTDELKIIPLAYGGNLQWPNGATSLPSGFGNWEAAGVSCSNRDSGGGIYVEIPNLGPVLYGPLSSRAEFSPVLTVPYDTNYGEELRVYFSNQSGLDIDHTQFVCMTATP